MNTWSKQNYRAEKEQRPNKNTLNPKPVGQSKFDSSSPDKRTRQIHFNIFLKAKGKNIFRGWKDKKYKKLSMGKKCLLETDFKV